MVAPDVRKQAFAEFVKRAARAAQLNRGWSLPRIAREAGIGHNTLYRWTKGQWDTSPEAALVEKFCKALDIPKEVAFDILWPREEERAATAPLPPDPRFEELQRRLADPSVPDREKFLIQETIDGLLARSVAPAKKAAG